jgi:FkbM family methyltransferase
MKSIFLDIGSHIGQTLEEVEKNYYNFDEIHCFEPCKLNYNILCKNFDKNHIYIHNFGLYSKNMECNLFSPGEMGASIFNDKIDLINVNEIEKIQLKNISEWIKNNLNINDTIFMKINCEGCECDIIENLLLNNIFDNINHIMIDFDVRKIPSQKHKEQEIMKSVFNKKNIDLCENVMIGTTHQNRIKNWLMMYKYECSK